MKTVIGAHILDTNLKAQFYRFEFEGEGEPTGDDLQAAIDNGTATPLGDPINKQDATPEFRIYQSF